MPAEVLMYRTPLCPYCIRARLLLEKKGAPFREINVAGDWERRSWLVRVTGRRTVPQIFINGVPIGGFDELRELEQRGRLDALLAQEPSGPSPACAEKQ
jgi:glutaredoxin 3